MSERYLSRRRRGPWSYDRWEHGWMVLFRKTVLVSWHLSPHYVELSIGSWVRSWVDRPERPRWLGGVGG